MENLSSLLIEFESQFINNKIKLFFQDGIENLEIFNDLEKYGLNADDEFKSLYQWKNGQKVYEGDIKFDIIENEIIIEEEIMNQIIAYKRFNVFFHYCDFQPLEKALALHKHNLFKMYPELFIFFLQDSYLLINLDNKSKGYKKIYAIDTAIPIVEPLLIFENLTAMFSTLISCYKKKIYYHNAQNELIIDDDEYMNEGYLLNPSCDYWKLMKNEINDYEYDVIPIKNWTQN